MQRLKFVGFFSVLLALTSQVWAQADLTILDVNAAAGSRVFAPVVISDGQRKMRKMSTTLRHFLE